MSTEEQSQGDVNLVKHKEYPVNNPFGDSNILHAHAVKIDVPDDSKEVSKDGNGEPLETKTTTVEIPSNTAPHETSSSPAGASNLSHHVKLDVHNRSSEKFAIEEHHQNTDKNPSKESTHTFPVLVRKAHSYEVLPRPFKTTNQYICVSYLSVLFCCFFGAIATHWAWKTKLQRNKGLYVVARKSANTAKVWIIASFATGSAILLIVLLTNLV